jgi:hypothetical protein
MESNLHYLAAGPGRHLLGLYCQQNFRSSLISHLESFSLESLAISSLFPFSGFLDADCTNSNSSTLLALADNSVMLASRSALRATRKSQIQPISGTARRLESATRPRDPRPSDRTNNAVVGGLVGGSFVALFGYAYYHYSGALIVVNTAYSAEKKFENTLKKA